MNNEKNQDLELMQRAILDSITDIVWVKDSQGRFMEVNQAFINTYGFKREEVIGKVDLDIWPRELAKNYYADDQDVMKSKKPKCVQERLARQEGLAQWMETVKTPFFDDQGKVIGLIGIARDISQRKKEDERLKDIRAELELRVKVRTAELTNLNEELRKEICERKGVEAGLMDSETKFRTIFEDLSDGMLMVEAESKQTFLFNKTICRMLGYTEEEMKDVCVKDIHAEKDLPRILEIFEQQANKEFLVAQDLPVKKKDGSIFYADISASPVVLNGKKYLLGSFRDITKKKEIELQLQAYHEKLEILVKQRTKELEAEIELRKAEELKAKFMHQHLERILAATKIGLNIIDKNFNLRYVDSQWALRYGDWIGRKCFEYFMDRASFCPDCAVEKALKAKKVIVNEKILVKESNRPVQVTTIPFEDENGQWLAAEVNIDISEKKKIDEELWRYRAHLEKLVGERTTELLQETARCRNSEVEKNKLNRELIKINKKLKSISLIDSLTGLYNYRYLQDVVEAEFHQARRYAQHLAIIMMDIDYFKSINDVYGIAFGDLVLKQLAKQLKRMMRRYDILIRYSGEEFIIVSSRLNREAALNMAQRLLDSLNFINFGNKNHSVKLKLSFSVVSFPEDRANSGIDLVNLANKVLNKVKDSGGNRAYSLLDIKSPLKKGLEKISKITGVKTLKNTIDKLNKQSKQGLTESIFAFAKTLELKDHYTGEHVENTVYYATEVAKGLDLAKDDIELIRQAAMLHDLGKIGISENILLKKGKLNKKEFEEIKKHPQIGADIIRPIQFLHALIPFIFYHHERWDGKGYPSGIRGEDIPLGARIIAIADVYQALTSDRPYHKAFTKDDALEIIKKSSGTQFDPRIVSAFLKIINKEKKPRS